eukprot:CAMPEP_0202841042 /NCGR_PEP_ID=MMETSP1389-20130828/57391_1 /ASSEMBLY_ACC=CAM_ASM_000865 /TAXON_ID=302021 /ORGANISM="Rhodomonas sp., Strain CCMP768" /LENGTH=91 /DNA_ID=CAMNT_0049517799 /DNA_START=188 /DNA_END=460 /DNA_ORIENTATION=+
MQLLQAVSYVATGAGPANGSVHAGPTTGEEVGTPLVGALRSELGRGGGRRRRALGGCCGGFVFDLVRELGPELLHHLVHDRDAVADDDLLA